MPWVGFEPANPVYERSRPAHATEICNKCLNSKVLCTPYVTVEDLKLSRQFSANMEQVSECYNPKIEFIMTWLANNNTLIHWSRIVEFYFIFHIISLLANYPSRMTGKSKVINTIALMMEAANTSKMSVNFYQTIRRNNPEDSHLHVSRMFIHIYIILLFHHFTYYVITYIRGDSWGQAKILCLQNFVFKARYKATRTNTSWLSH
jgi:uncharacterized membrane protein